MQLELTPDTNSSLDPPLPVPAHRHSAGLRTSQLSNSLVPLTPEVDTKVNDWNVRHPSRQPPPSLQHPGTAGLDISSDESTPLARNFAPEQDGPLMIDDFSDTASSFVGFPSSNRNNGNNKASLLRKDSLAEGEMFPRLSPAGSIRRKTLHSVHVADGGGALEITPISSSLTPEQLAMMLPPRVGDRKKVVEFTPMSSPASSQVERRYSLTHSQLHSSSPQHQHQQQQQNNKSIALDISPDDPPLRPSTAASKSDNKSQFQQQQQQQQALSAFGESNFSIGGPAPVAVGGGSIVGPFGFSTNSFMQSSISPGGSVSPPVATPSPNNKPGGVDRLLMSELTDESESLFVYHSPKQVDAAPQQQKKGYYDSSPSPAPNNNNNNNNRKQQKQQQLPVPFSKRRPSMTTEDDEAVTVGGRLVDGGALRAEPLRDEGELASDNADSSSQKTWTGTADLLSSSVVGSPLSPVHHRVTKSQQKAADREKLAREDQKARVIEEQQQQQMKKVQEEQQQQNQKQAAEQEEQRLRNLSSQQRQLAQLESAEMSERRATVFHAWERGTVELKAQQTIDRHFLSSASSAAALHSLSSRQAQLMLLEAKARRSDIQFVQASEMLLACATFRLKSAFLERSSAAQREHSKLRAISFKAQSVDSQRRSVETNSGALRRDLEQKEAREFVELHAEAAQTLSFRLCAEQSAATIRHWCNVRDFIKQRAKDRERVFDRCLLARAVSEDEEQRVALELLATEAIQRVAVGEYGEAAARWRVMLASSAATAAELKQHRHELELQCIKTATISVQFVEQRRRLELEAAAVAFDRVLSGRAADMRVVREEFDAEAKGMRSARDARLHLEAVLERDARAHLAREESFDRRSQLESLHIFLVGSQSIVYKSEPSGRRAVESARDAEIERSYEQLRRTSVDDLQHNMERNGRRELREEEDGAVRRLFEPWVAALRLRWMGAALERVEGRERACIENTEYGAEHDALQRRSMSLVRQNLRDRFCNESEPRVRTLVVEEEQDLRRSELWVMHEQGKQRLAREPMSTFCARGAGTVATEEQQLRDALLQQISAFHAACRVSFLPEAEKDGRREIVAEEHVIAKATLFAEALLLSRRALSLQLLAQHAVARRSVEASADSEFATVAKAEKLQRHLALAISDCISRERSDRLSLTAQAHSEYNFVSKRYAAFVSFVRAQHAARLRVHNDALAAFAEAQTEYILVAERLQRACIHVHYLRVELKQAQRQRDHLDSSEHYERVLLFRRKQTDKFEQRYHAWRSELVAEEMREWVKLYSVLLHFASTAVPQHWIYREEVERRAMRAEFDQVRVPLQEGAARTCVVAAQERAVRHHIERTALLQLCVREKRRDILGGELDERAVISANHVAVELFQDEEQGRAALFHEQGRIFVEEIHCASLLGLCRDQKRREITVPEALGFREIQLMNWSRSLQMSAMRGAAEIASEARRSCAQLEATLLPLLVRTERQHMLVQNFAGSFRRDSLDPWRDELFRLQRLELDERHFVAGVRAEMVFEATELFFGCVALEEWRRMRIEADEFHAVEVQLRHQRVFMLESFTRQSLERRLFQAQRKALERIVVSIDSARDRVLRGLAEEQRVRMEGSSRLASWPRYGSNEYCSLAAMDAAEETQLLEIIMSHHDHHHQPEQKQDDDADEAALRRRRRIAAAHQIALLRRTASISPKRRSMSPAAADPAARRAVVAARAHAFALSAPILPLSARDAEEDAIRASILNSNGSDDEGDVDDNEEQLRLRLSRVLAPPQLPQPLVHASEHFSSVALSDSLRRATRAENSGRCSIVLQHSISMERRIVAVALVQIQLIESSSRAALLRAEAIQSLELSEDGQRSRIVSEQADEHLGQHLLGAFAVLGKPAPSAHVLWSQLLRRFTDREAAGRSDLAEYMAVEVQRLRSSVEVAQCQRALRTVRALNEVAGRPLALNAANFLHASQWQSSSSSSVGYPVSVRALALQLSQRCGCTLGQLGREEEETLVEAAVVYCALAVSGMWQHDNLSALRSLTLEQQRGLLIESISELGDRSRDELGIESAALALVEIADRETNMFPVSVSMFGTELLLLVDCYFDSAWNGASRQLSPQAIRRVRNLQQQPGSGSPRRGGGSQEMTAVSMDSSSRSWTPPRRRSPMPPSPSPSSPPPRVAEFSFFDRLGQQEDDSRVHVLNLQDQARSALQAMGTSDLAAVRITLRHSALLQERIALEEQCRAARLAEVEPEQLRAWMMLQRRGLCDISQTVQRLAVVGVEATERSQIVVERNETKQNVFVRSLGSPYRLRSGQQQQQQQLEDEESQQRREQELEEVRRQQPSAFSHTVRRPMAAPNAALSHTRKRWLEQKVSPPPEAASDTVAARDSPPEEKRQRDRAVLYNTPPESPLAPAPALATPSPPPRTSNEKLFSSTFSGTPHRPPSMTSSARVADMLKRAKMM